MICLIAGLWKDLGLKHTCPKWRCAGVQGQIPFLGDLHSYLSATYEYWKMLFLAVRFSCGKASTVRSLQSSLFVWHTSRSNLTNIEQWECKLLNCLVHFSALESSSRARDARAKGNSSHHLLAGTAYFTVSYLFLGSKFQNRERRFALK